MSIDSKPHSLLVVGSVGLDDVETRIGKRAGVLGGAASYFSVAASFLAPPRMVAVVGTDFPADHTALFERHGVDLAGLERVPGETFRWSGVYSPDFMNRTTLDTRLNVFSDFRPKLPAGWGKSDLVFLANIDPKLQISVLEQADKPKFVACDTMNFWIAGKRPELLRLLARVDMLLAERRGGAPAVGRGEPAGGGARHPGSGPQRRRHQARRRGRAALSRGGRVRGAGLPDRERRRSDGRGRFVRGRLHGLAGAHRHRPRPRAFRTAMILGSVLASFAVEDFSLDRFRTLDLSQIRERFAAFADLVHFEKIRI